MLGSGLLLAAGILATSTQDDAREELDGLIEITDGLAHFHVEFEVTTRDEVSRLTIDYLAPHSMRIRTTYPCGDRQTACNDEHFWQRRSCDDEVRSRVDFDLLDRAGPCEAAIAALRDCSWEAVGGPEVFLGMPWDLEPAKRASRWDASIETTRFGAASGPLLGWLASLRRLEGELAIEGDYLVHRAPDSTAYVSRKSGFLQRLQLRLAGADTVTIDRVELDLLRAPDAGLFATPEPAPAAKDLTASWRDYYYTPALLRRLALERVHGLLERGERSLDEELRGELERFLAAVHDPAILAWNGPWLAGVWKYQAQFAFGILMTLAIGGPVERLEARADEIYELMIDDLDRQRVALRKSMPADPEAYAASPHWRALRELEDAVLDARFDALIASPMTENYELRIDGILDD